MKTMSGRKELLKKAREGQEEVKKGLKKSKPLKMMTQ